MTTDILPLPTVQIQFLNLSFLHGSKSHTSSEGAISPACQQHQAAYMHNVQCAITHIFVTSSFCVTLVERQLLAAASDLL